jgi:hypothetical protein
MSEQSGEPRPEEGEELRDVELEGDEEGDEIAERVRGGRRAISIP